MEARLLPDSPGVYFWRDAEDEVLYVGKAVNLRARVTSYFSTAAHDRRTRDLLSRARSITHELTSTELEALFRESALIKQMQPPFNRALRTSRQPFYLKFDGARRDPFMEVARSRDDPASLYFGPFRTGGAVRETMAFLHAVLPLRKCTAAAPKCRPCIYYQMHTCAAPALDDEHRAKHQEAIGQLFDMLDGRTDRVTDWLERKRDKLSEVLLFERAAEIQERLDHLKGLERQHAILEAAMQCRCVVVRQFDETQSVERMLLIAHGHVLSVRDGRELDAAAVLRWIRAHHAVIGSVQHQQSEIDAASVLERWIVCNRKHVRWVAIPPDATEDDLLDRIVFVLGTAKERDRPGRARPTSGQPVSAGGRVVASS
jgi:excinuclease ABC subunit C